MTEEERKVWDAIVDEVIASNKELLTRIVNDSPVFLYGKPALSDEVNG